MLRFTRQRVMWFLVLGALTVPPGPARATSIISNYPAGNGLGEVGFFTGVTAEVGFTMPSGPAYALDSVTMRLATESPTPSQVALFADASGAPVGPALVTFNSVIIPATFGTDVTVTPTTPFVLRPSTTYWLGLTSTLTNGDYLDWSADLPGVAPTGIATQVVNTAFGPGTFLSGDNYPGTNGGTGTENVIYQVDGQVVPEPSAVVLLGTGLAALTIAGRRTRRGRTSTVG